MPNFNLVDPQVLVTVRGKRHDARSEIEGSVLRKLDQALFYLFPNGKTHRHHFLIGNIHGNEGESLKVELEGVKAGQWYDFATGEGGDIFDLWGGVKGWDARSHFPEIMGDMEKWLGIAPSQKPRSQKKKKQDDLGSPTGKWDYHDVQGNLIACVYRYDTSSGKEFRPLDIKSQKFKAPEPRPLYNQPGMAKSQNVILVEGEKCAEALIQQGFCATTAMGGANAPLDKTDWSPLRGKHVLVWPDHDQPGREYSEKVIAYLQRQHVLSLSRVHIADDVPEKWDAADAVAEGRNIEAFLKYNVQVIEKEELASSWDDLPPVDFDVLPAFTLGDYYAATDPIPEDLIAPRILTPEGLLVFGGAPKVGKTDFLLSWLVHMAAGSSFMGMHASRPLKIFYLQTEIGKPYLQERIQHLSIPQEILERAFTNLVITPQIRFFLDENGVERAHQTIMSFFKPDIIVIDPLRNVFDGKSENDNMEMLAFLQDRVEALRLMTNPLAGVMLVHHTRKIGKTELADDPFQALSGASCLRSFYTTGMILSRPDEKKSLRHLVFELRCGKPLASKHVDKIQGQWCEMDIHNERIIRKDYGEQCDSERRRRAHVILQILFEEAQRGTLYTSTEFSGFFQGKKGLGSARSIHEDVKILATKGFIKFNQEEKNPGSKYGILCVEGMEIPSGQEEVDPETGEITPILKPFLPTHFKNRRGEVLPVEDRAVWVYPKDSSTSVSNTRDSRGLQI